jgi:hypothetical protein
MNRLVAALLLASLLPLPACTAMRRMASGEKEDLMVAAGFTIKSADTPEAAAKLKKLEPFKMIRRVKDGQMYYTYADPDNCQCMFVGNSTQYMEFQRLLLKKQIADEHMQAAEANEAAAMDMEWAWW